MPLTIAGLVSAFLLSFTTLAGPDPRDATTNKPTPEACAAARAAGRSLPGCDVPNEAQPDSAQEEERRPEGRERFIVCPGDARCPR